VAGGHASAAHTAGTAAEDKQTDPAGNLVSLFKKARAVAWPDRLAKSDISI
jgi:hypothetical protein